MGRTVIKKTECAFCHKIFDLATEDFDWGKKTDMGERDNDPSFHDYALSQMIVCPKCEKENEILLTLEADEKGMNETILSITNVSLEKSEYFQ